MSDDVQYSAHKPMDERKASVGDGESLMVKLSQLILVRRLISHPQYSS